MYEENNNFIEFDPDALCEQDNPVSESKPAPSMDAINNTVAKMFANAGITNCNYKEDHEYIKSPKKAEGKADPPIDIATGEPAVDVCDDKGRVDWKKLVAFLDGSTEYVIIDGTVHAYIPKTGMYTPVTKKCVDGMLATRFGKTLLTTEQETRNIRKSLLALAEDTASEVTPTEGLIPYKDGDYLIHEGVFLPPSPERIVLSRLPHNFPVDAKPTEFIDNSLKLWSNGDPDTARQLIQILGFALLGQQRYIKKLVLLIGEGDTGKSSFLDLIEAMLGEKNVSNLTLSEICGSNRFATADLHGKMANVCAEFDDKYVANPETLKKLTGGDTLRAEFKGENGFTFRAHAGIFVATNQMPRIADPSNAVANRLYLVEFRNKIDRTAFKGDLEAEMRKPENIAYAMSLAIEGARELDRDRKFFEPERSKELVQEFKDFNDPIKGWLDEIDPEEYIYDKPTSWAFASYSSWARDNGVKMPLTPNGLGRLIHQRLDVVTERRTENGKTICKYVRRRF